MSLEQIIRERQKKRQKLTEYLSFASLMPMDYLELGLARIADLMNAETSEAEISHCKLKGSLLKAYYDMRCSGAIQQASMTSVDRENLKKYDPLITEWKEKCNQLQDMWRNMYQADIRNGRKPGIAREMPKNKLPPAPSKTLPTEEILLHIISVYRIIPKGATPDMDVNIPKILNELT